MSSIPSESTSDPLISVGLPVYNGASSVSEAIRSLLAQTHRNIELIISDNASTDSSQDILRRWSEQDPRIRLILNPVNRGATENFKLTANQATGEFFMWAAHDDLWEPDFIECNLRKLRETPGAICSICLVARVRDGHVTGLTDDTFPLAGTPEENVVSFLKRPGLNSRMYGLYQTRVAKHAADVGTFWGFDLLVTVRTLAFGTHAQVDRVLMSRHSGGESSNMPKAVRYYNRGSVIGQLFPKLRYTVALLREPHVRMTVPMLWIVIVQNTMDTLFVVYYALYERLTFLRPLLRLMYRIARRKAFEDHSTS